MKAVFILSLLFFVSLRLFAISTNNLPTIHTTTIILSVTTTNTTCQKKNGKIIIQATGGVAPYSFTCPPWGTNTTGIFIHLSAGSYSITVADAVGNTAIQTVILTNTFSSPIASVASINIASTCNVPDATLTLTGSGGLSPYTYSIDNINYQAGNTFTNLTAGVYMYAIKDVNGCSSFPSPLGDFTSIQNSSNCTFHCDGSGGTIACDPYVVHVFLKQISGGTPPYMYSVDGSNYQTNSDFDYLSAGMHRFRIKDATGLIALYSTSYIDNCNPPFLVSTVMQPANCGQNGIITATATDGSPPYQYSLDGVNFQNNNQFTGLTPGNYTIIVKDFYNFTSSKFVVVTNNCVSITATTVDDYCGSAKGTISAIGSNGTPPYLFSINGINFQSSPVFNNLPAATYTVSVKDALNAIGSTIAVIKNIPGPQVSATNSSPSCLDNDGSITLAGSNGTAPLQYSLDGNNYQVSPVFNSLKAGIYKGWVKDANGCKNSVSVLLSTSNNLGISAGSSFAVCKGDSKKINATGNGTSYLWSPAAGLDNTASLTPVATPAQTTKYYITATLGVCTKKDSVVISVNPTPVAVAQGTTTVCFGQNASLKGSGAVTYTWSPSTYLDNAAVNNPSVIKPLTNITYKLKVTDANGCKSQNDASVTVTVTAPVKVFAGNDTSVVIDQLFQLHARDINNSGLVHFEWTPVIYLNDAGTANPVSTPGRDILYTVTASTAAGCEGSDEVRIKVFKGPDIYVPTAFTPNGDGLNDVLKAIPIGIKKFEYFVLYNRYGEKVFYTEDATKGWDGKFKNADQPLGTFTWVAKGVDDRGKDIYMKGAVTLIR